jgi:hypothetical protein
MLKYNSQEDIDYLNLLEDSPYYSVGIFFVKKGKGLPFHDHQNMMVFTKVLWGEIDIISLDLNNSNDNNENKNDSEILVKQTKLISLKENNTSVLTPSLMNVHQVMGVEDSAFLDILIPDYSYINSLGTCNYYDVYNKNDKLYAKILH